MGLLLFFQGPTAPSHMGSTVENKVDDSTERALYSKPHEPSGMPREDPLIDHETKLLGAKNILQIQSRLHMWSIRTTPTKVLHMTKVLQMTK